MNPAVYQESVAITNNTPSSSSGLSLIAYSISPALPAGLSFDTGLGTISGTPTAVSPGTTYTVTATSPATATVPGGITTVTLVIAVSDTTCSAEANTNCTAAGEICAPGGLCVTPIYTDNGDGTVTEALTGLVWQQTVSSEYDWSSTGAAGSAQAYCDGLSLSGAGWTVPSVQQLFSLVLGTTDPTINETFFPPGTPTNFFWSSTPYSTGAAWNVNFFYGLASSYGVTGYDFVRCVR